MKSSALLQTCALLGLLLIVLGTVGCASPAEQFTQKMDVVADRAIPLLMLLVEVNPDLDGDGRPDMDQLRKDAMLMWLRNWRDLVNAAMGD